MHGFFYGQNAMVFISLTLQPRLTQIIRLQKQVIEILFGVVHDIYSLILKRETTIHKKFKLITNKSRKDNLTT